MNHAESREPWRSVMYFSGSREEGFYVESIEEQATKLLAGLALGDSVSWALVLKWLISGEEMRAVIASSKGTAFIHRVAELTLSHYQSECKKRLAKVTRNYSQCIIDLSAINTIDKDGYAEEFVNYTMLKTIQIYFDGLVVNKKSDAAKYSGNISCHDKFYDNANKIIFMCIGQMQGILATTKWHRKSMSSQLARLSIGERWDLIARVKENITSQASREWNRGSILLHNEMADKLLRENQEASRLISKPVLLASLKPIAARYGKVRGLKGIRKEKLPPT